MTKHYIAMTAIFAAIGLVTLWALRQTPGSSIGMTPGVETAPNINSGLLYMSYNNSFNPGPPVNNILPATTSGLNGVKDTSCTCPRLGGRF